MTMNLDRFDPRRLILGSTRLILSIGDEAAVLTLVKGRDVVDAWVASPDPDDGAADVLAALSAHKRVPVSVLIDAFEQQFREEKVPHVGLLDQAKVVDRHLHMAFPGQNLQAAMSHGRDPQGTRFYLFASVPPTEQVKGWLRVLDDAGRSPAGIHMLPLESMEMMRLLTPDHQVAGVRWRMLFSFNMTGGLRQIVSKQRRIMVTRLTPPPPPDSTLDPVAIIERDFGQTLSYVKRMGYQTGDYLDLVILAEEPLASALREQTWEASSLTVVSPFEAAGRLGLGKAGQPGTPYADVLHALWFATRPKPALSLHWSYRRKIDVRRLIIRGAPTTAVFSVLALLGAVGSLGFDLWEALRDVETQTQLRAATQDTLAAEQRKLAALPFRAQEMRPTIATLDALQRDGAPPVALLARLNHALGGSAVVEDLTVDTPRLDDDSRGRGRGRAGQAEEPRLTLAVVVRLPADTPDDASAVGHAETLEKSLRSAFPGYTVVMTRPPVEINPDQVLRGNVAGSTGTASLAPLRSSSGYTASFAITEPAEGAGASS